MFCNVLKLLLDNGLPYEFWHGTYNFSDFLIKIINANQIELLKIIIDFKDFDINKQDHEKNTLIHIVLQNMLQQHISLTTIKMLFDIKNIDYTLENENGSNYKDIIDCQKLWT